VGNSDRVFNKLLLSKQLLVNVFHVGGFIKDHLLCQITGKGKRKNVGICLKAKGAFILIIVHESCRSNSDILSLSEPLVLHVQELEEPNFI
jgi:hypothetical protein